MSAGANSSAQRFRRTAMTLLAHLRNGRKRQQQRNWRTGAARCREETLKILDRTSDIAPTHDATRYKRTLRRWVGVRSKALLATLSVE